MQKSSWAENEPALRAEWETKYGKSGLDWEEIREAHRFGWEVSLRPEFSGAKFEDVETDLAQHWYRPLSATEENAWDYIREAAAEGWRQARMRSGQRTRER